jgi:shikimate kinase
MRSLLVKYYLKINQMPSDIILIGPIGAGKSTIGLLLATRIGLPQCSMDEYRWNYYKEIGYDEELAKHKRETEGFWGIYQYWKPFEAHAVERLLSEHRNCVIDFGAGHSVYEDYSLFQRVQRVLASYSNIILLLPSSDLDESVQILNERNEYVPDGNLNINEHFVRHPSNYNLAKFTVYTKAKTLEEICNEILQLVGAV